MAERSRQELNFIDQYTRKLCVEWALVSVEHGGLPEAEFSDEAIEACPYKKHAAIKGWLTKKAPRRLSAGGWARAVAWLKK